MHTVRLSNLDEGGYTFELFVNGYTTRLTLKSRDPKYKFNQLLIVADPKIKDALKEIQSGPKRPELARSSSHDVDDDTRKRLHVVIKHIYQDQRRSRKK